MDCDERPFRRLHSEQKQGGCQSLALVVCAEEFPFGRCRAAEKAAKTQGIRRESLECARDGGHEVVTLVGKLPNTIVGDRVWVNDHDGQ